MTAVEFAYWLQGFFELSQAGSSAIPALNPAQVAMVQAHLALVFKHDIDPKAGGAAVQAALNAVHAGGGGFNPGGEGGGGLIRC